MTDHTARSSRFSPIQPADIAARFDETTFGVDRRTCLKQLAGTICGLQALPAAAASRSLRLLAVVPVMLNEAGSDASAADRPAVDPPDGMTPSDTPRTSLVRVKPENQDVQSLTGRILVRAIDGGLLLEDRSGRLWTLPPDQIVEQSERPEVFQRFTHDELCEHVAREAADAGVSGQFTAHITGNYAVSTNASDAYARWCGGLLERLNKALQNYWTAQGIEVASPDWPLPVLIVSNRSEFAKLAEYDRSPGSAQGQGYYSITANRIVLFDLTTEGNGATAGTSRSVADVKRVALRNPASIAAVIHEATHQIAFNCGLHRRYADNPVWLTEGMAMYFETPDLRSDRGWRGIGKVNPVRLARFQDFARNRRAEDSLITLLQDDQRFTTPEQAVDAYAEAWAFTWYLMDRHREQYVAYLRRIAERPLLKWETSEGRLAEFEAACGSPVSDLSAGFMDAMQRLKP